MSSVGSSDSTNSSSRQEDVNRRRSEEAKANEQELAKRQAEKIRRMSDQHYAELEKLKNAHQAQIEDLRRATSQEVNERDHKYQQEMEEVRGLYRKQLQEQADDSQRHEGSVRRALTGELEQTKAQAADRAKSFDEQAWKNHEKQHDTINEISQDMEEGQKEGINKTRERLTNHYDKREKAQQAERNERVGELQRSFDEYRSETQAERRDRELNHMQGQKRASDNLLRAVKGERMVAQDTADSLRDGFKDGIEKTRDRFEKANRREREAGAMFREGTKGSVSERIDKQVTRLEQENVDLKEAKVREAMHLKAKQQREIANVADSYQKNMDNYREQRDEAVRQSNERTHKDVEKVRKDLDQRAVETNRFYKGQEEELNKVHRTAFGNLKGNFDTRAEHLKNTTEQRVKNLLEYTNEEKARLAELQTETHIASQHSHQDDMRALRDAMEADKQVAVNSLTEHIQKQELHHAERMNQVVSKYEKQVRALEDRLIKEKKINEENLKRANDEMQRVHKLSVDQLAMQNRDRVRKLNQQHGEEVREINKRHDETIGQVIGEVKRS